VGGTTTLLPNHNIPPLKSSTPASTVEIPKKSRTHSVEKSRENRRKRLNASRPTFLSKGRTTELSTVQRQQLQLQAGFHTLANVDLISHLGNMPSMDPSRGPVTAVSKYDNKSLSTSPRPRFVSTEDNGPKSKSESKPIYENASRVGETDLPGVTEHPDCAKLAQIYDSSASHVNDSSHVHQDDSGLRNDLFLSHVDGEGKASMVGVAAKRDTFRAAEAEGRIKIGATAAKLVAENGMKKGDVLSVSQLAGVMGAKATSSLIPLCHPLLITNIAVKLTLDVEHAAVVVRTRVECTGKTGVEMEALMGASIALLTVYDMCKAVSKDMVITDVHLVTKTGGKTEYKKT